MNRKKIELNDIAKYYAWPERMLGLSSWTVTPRTLEKSEREYNHDKYLPCLRKFEERKGNITIEEMKSFELGDDNAEVCVSFGDELYLMKFGEVKEAYYELIRDTLAEPLQKSQTVLELGSGYGYNLAMLQRSFPDLTLRWRGGEYADNAVELGNKFAGGDTKIEKFDFYETPYKIFDTLTEPITVFTVYGTHQLPSAKSILPGLRQHKDKIERVVYFESVYEHYDEKTLLSMMRKRYIELCDYNRDMLTLLRAAEDVEIVSERKNVMGLNPFLPLSVIEWKFK